MTLLSSSTIQSLTLISSTAHFARRAARHISRCSHGVWSGCSPYPHQERILEALEVARVVHDRHRNLVVAATGAGKTVVAALDYQNLCDAAGRRLSLLVVAHRKEILEQSLRKYREVLGDGNFGELYVDGLQAVGVDPCDFASVQSLSSRGARDFDATHFDVIVIDEFHHAAAETYRSLLSRVTPSNCLALRLPQSAATTRHPRLVRWASHLRAAAVERPRTRPTVPIPLLRDRRQHRPT